MDKVKVALSKPIQAHGEQVSELSFDEPTGGDIMSCGYPLQIGDGTATPIASVVAKYIVRLGKVPPSAVSQMSAGDFQKCVAAILPFFGEE